MQANGGHIQDTPILNVKSLLLAGGQSTRMGTPKHLLPFKDGQPLYLHMLQELQAACPEVDTFYISLRRASAVDDQLRSSPMIWPKGSGRQMGRMSIKMQMIYDHDDPESGDARHLDGQRTEEGTDMSLGPAAGLVAAYRTDPTAHWLVVACDYPLLKSSAISQLRSAYTEPVTCFQNADGYCEPLLGIWGPEALSRLEENVRVGKTSPSAVVRELKGKLVSPPMEEMHCLFNANTKEDWDRARRIARSRAGVQR